MNKEVWKICWKNPEYSNTPYCYSAMTKFRGFPTQYSLLYKIGKKTFPEDGKIFCFDTVKNVNYFLKYSGLERLISEIVIMRGIAYNVSCPKFVAREWMDIPGFWKRKRQHKALNFSGPLSTCSSITSEAAPGTITCDAFLPFEQFTYAQFSYRFIIKMKEKS